MALIVTFIDRCGNEYDSAYLHYDICTKQRYKTGVIEFSIWKNKTKYTNGKAPVGYISIPLVKEDEIVIEGITKSFKYGDIKGKTSQAVYAKLKTVKIEHPDGIIDFTISQDDLD